MGKCKQTHPDQPNRQNETKKVKVKLDFASFTKSVDSSDGSCEPTGWTHEGVLITPSRAALWPINREESKPKRSKTTYRLPPLPIAPLSPVPFESTWVSVNEPIRTNRTGKTRPKRSKSNLTLQFFTKGVNSSDGSCEPTGWTHEMVLITPSRAALWPINREE